MNNLFERFFESISANQMTANIWQNANIISSALEKDVLHDWRDVLCDESLVISSYGFWKDDEMNNSQQII